MGENASVTGEEAGRDWITIVSGLPRSGTSMMMQLLEAGGLSPLTDNVRQPDDDNPRGYYEFEAVKQVQQDATWLDQARGRVVKMVYRLLYDLPAKQRYRVIFMKRRLQEVIASQEEMLRRHGRASETVDEAQLVGIYQRQLHEIERWLQNQRNFRVLYVDYHDVLEQPEQVVGELDRFLGGTLDTARMLQVPDRSLYRQRR